MFPVDANLGGSASTVWVGGPDGAWKCHDCHRVNTLKHQSGTHVFHHVGCECGHVICTGCSSDLLDLDPSRKLRAGDPLEVAPFGTKECPYFSLCPGCGLSHRAKASKSGGIIKAPIYKLTFKPYGEPCGSCGLKVTSRWLRASILATSRFGVTPPNEQQSQSLLSTLKSTTRLLSSRSSRNAEGDASATPRRSKWADNDNLPGGWECYHYDGSVYYWRDGEGQEYKTEPGSRYGPFTRI